jgi:hypothetical protein
MKYLVYRTTNILNGKYYIGSHATTKLNDGYLGSGILLKQSIKKHGKESFTREILAEFDTLQEMRQHEMVLVAQCCKDRKSYNLSDSGHGSVCGDNNVSKRPEVRKKISESMKGNTNCIGRKDSQKTINKRAAHFIKDWTITFPDGHSESIRNLRSFCREHNLSAGNMVSRGHTKGYSCIKN